MFPSLIVSEACFFLFISLLVCLFVVCLLAVCLFACLMVDGLMCLCVDLFVACLFVLLA